MPEQQGRAVIIGGGIGGLTTAAELSAHFREVVVVEKNALPVDDGPRGGVPQAAHVHGLLALGAQHLERLFPGLRAELHREHGAPIYDHGSGARTRVWAGTLPPHAAGIEVQTVHRNTLEGAMRRRVRALPQVTVRDATSVEGLVVDVVNNRVRGLLLHAGSGEPDELMAELVVDASGRFTRLPVWLEQAGYPRPDETVVDGGLAYATRTLSLSEAESPLPGVHGLQQMNQAPARPGGVYAADVGGSQWIITLFGAGGHHPPTDDAGWRRFAAELGNPELDLLLQCGTLDESEARQFRATENRRREYAAMSRWPDRLIALGDSYCAANPVFGQGMTLAIRQAAALGEALGGHQGVAGLARPFQRRIARLVREPWLMATSEDLVWSAVTRGESLGVPWRLAAWYKQRLLHVAVHETTNPHVLRTFMAVFHQLASPAAMARPRFLAKVLFRARSPHRPGV